MGFFPALERAWHSSGVVTAQSPFQEHGMEDGTQSELHGSLGVRRASVSPLAEGIN